MLPDIWPGKRYNGHTNGCGSGKAATETRSRFHSHRWKATAFPWLPIFFGSSIIFFLFTGQKTAILLTPLLAADPGF